MNYKYCQNCGNRMPTNAIFCPVCGTKQENVSNQISQLQYQEANKPNSSHLAKVLSSLDVIVILIAGISLFNGIKEIDGSAFMYLINLTLLFLILFLIGWLSILTNEFKSNRRKIKILSNISGCFTIVLFILSVISA